MVRNINRSLSIKLILSCLSLFLTGCNRTSFSYPYDSAAGLSAYSLNSSSNGTRGDFFASSLAVVDKDMGSAYFDEETDRAVGLFDVSAAETIVSRSVHEQLYPASTTKVMTALLALKNSNPEDKITVSGNATTITESGATLLGLKAGDTLTMDQALHALLLYSANDVALAIAEHVAGSISEFCDMMNQEARSIGATNTHFVNPHGLHDPDHYTTAYDMYLMFNEAIKFQRFVEIINTKEYTSTYYDRNGEEKKMELKSTNLFLRGEASVPEGINVLGGKTGTTNAAGANLVLLTQDISGNPFISVILHDTTREMLYKDMGALLDQVPKS